MDEKSEQKQEENKESFTQSFKQSLWEFVKFIVIAAVIVVPIRLWVAQPFIVSGSSMVPTFENGEYLVIDEFSYHFRQPARGEVIIFRYPQDHSKFFIKRIAGLPGERLEIKNSKIYVYNTEFPEGFTLDESYLSKNLAMADTSITLGNTEYYVLGDNRTMSSDSRYWGPLSNDLVIGRAWLRLWPFDKISVFP